MLRQIKHCSLNSHSPHYFSSHNLIYNTKGRKHYYFKNNQKMTMYLNPTRKILNSNYRSNSSTAFYTSAGAQSEFNPSIANNVKHQMEGFFRSRGDRVKQRHLFQVRHGLAKMREFYEKQQKEQNEFKNSKEEGKGEGEGEVGEEDMNSGNTTTIQENDRYPIILHTQRNDTGDGAYTIAKQYPNTFVLGNSAVSQKPIEKIKSDTLTLDDLPENCHILAHVPARQVWRSLLEPETLNQISVQRHFVFYPQHYPKLKNYKQRLYASPLMFDLLRLGGTLELRTFWDIYAREFQASLEAACEHLECYESRDQIRLETIPPEVVHNWHRTKDVQDTEHIITPIDKTVVQQQNNCSLYHLTLDLNPLKDALLKKMSPQ
eukprot:gb/GECH01002572.1/.p1 GENE.gb/GECH01002572.1/~~gb/GECH01002572.1/.p1  ORF type:complete len:375 (+),score=86.77 gb/GECH01002572.1/:1-1125(+)